MALIIGVCLFFLNRVLISNIREETTLRAKESAEVLSEMLNDSSDKGILLKHYGKFIESLKILAPFTKYFEQLCIIDLKINGTPGRQKIFLILNPGAALDGL